MAKKIYKKIWVVELINVGKKIRYISSFDTKDKAVQCIVNCKKYYDVNGCLSIRERVICL